MGQTSPPNASHSERTIGIALDVSLPIMQASSKHRLERFFHCYSNLYFSRNRWLDCLFLNLYRIPLSAERTADFAKPDFPRFLLIFGHNHHLSRYFAGTLESTNTSALDLRGAMITIMN